MLHGSDNESTGMPIYISRRQARNRAMTDVVVAGDLAHPLAVTVAAADLLTPLLGGKLRRPSRIPLACLGPLPVFPGAGQIIAHRRSGLHGAWAPRRAGGCQGVDNMM
jgi:hypothetical protein